MTFARLKYLIASDLYRMHQRVSLPLLIRELFFGVGVKYMFWLRLRSYLLEKRSPLWAPLRLLARIMHRHYTFKFGVGISPEMEIGPSFYIGHFGTIFLNGEARIGKVCSISQGVTIGVHKGVPTIGDYVYIGPGAKLMNGIRVGNNVAIGANCVVTKDVPDNAVVVGIPGRVISLEGNYRDDAFRRKHDYELVAGPMPQ